MLQQEKKILEVTNEHNIYVTLCSINEHINALSEKVELSSGYQGQLSEHKILGSEDLGMNPGFATN